jgi:hypothetical protein
MYLKDTRNERQALFAAFLCLASTKGALADGGGVEGDIFTSQARIPMDEFTDFMKYIGKNNQTAIMQSSLLDENDDGMVDAAEFFHIAEVLSWRVLKTRADESEDEPQHWKKITGCPLGCCNRVLSRPRAWPIRESMRQFTKLSKRLVNSCLFNPFIMIAVLLNTIVFVLEASSNPEDDVALYAINTACAVVFVFEAAFKIVALTWPDYIFDPWNKFDFLLVVFSLVSDIMLLLVPAGDADVAGDADAARSTKTLRLSKLTKLVKIFRVMKSMRALRILHSGKASAVSFAFMCELYKSRKTLKDIRKPH